MLETDWVVGEILNVLDKLKIADNTLIIYTSDNGCSPQAKFAELQEQGHYPSYKFRGLKGTLWEGGHRMPFVARWPGKIKPGTQNDYLMCTTDLMATCAELLNVKLPDNAGEDSVSFLPALKGEITGQTHRGAIVHHSDSGKFAIRKGKWKLVLHEKGGSGRRNPKDKPVVNSDFFQLFDMDKDPEESTNLLRTYPEKARELQAELSELIHNGRSTPGPKQENEAGRKPWDQLDVLKIEIPPADKQAK